MKNLTNQIKKGLENDLYFLSLFVALTLPDICGAIDSKDGKANGEKYKNWFDKHIKKSALSGIDCYKFRCSLLHQGSSQHPESNYSRVLFVEPSATPNIFHNNIMNNALNIDVSIFCQDIIDGVNLWLKEVEDTELFKKNYNKFMRRYPKGLEPYIVGIPIIS